MQQSSCKDDSRLETKFYLFLCNQRASYLSQNCLPLDPILGQMNPIHSPHNFLYSFQYTPKSAKRYLLFG